RLGWPTRTTAFRQRETASRRRTDDLIADAAFLLASSPLPLDNVAVVCRRDPAQLIFGTARVISSAFASIPGSLVWPSPLCGAVFQFSQKAHLLAIIRVT